MMRRNYLPRFTANISFRSEVNSLKEHRHLLSVVHCRFCVCTNCGGEFENDDGGGHGGCVLIMLTTIS